MGLNTSVAPVPTWAQCAETFAVTMLLAHASAVDATDHARCRCGRLAAVCEVRRALEDAGLLTGRRAWTAA